MSAAIAIRYEDDTENPRAVDSVIHVEATDLTVNETQTAQNIIDGVYAAPITYYLSAEHDAGDHDDLVSIRFQGDHFTWDGVILPADGAWTIHVRQDSDDSSVASVAVTVDASA